MPKRSDVYKEWRKRYPPRVFNSPEQAENYKTMTKEKGLEYDVTEYNGQYYVDEPNRGHPYWRKAGQ